MKKITKATLLSVLVILMSCSNSVGPRITLKSLLQQMVQREEPTRFPNPNYSTKQASSYDRRSKSQDEGWFANGDRSYFEDVFVNEQGKHEHVLMDTKGPGAIVRFWAVTSHPDLLDGLFRIYIDGEKKARFEGSFRDLVGGNYFATYPLSMSVAKESEEHKRGRNLYLPIPYNKSIKMTYQHKNGRKLIEGEAAWPNDAFFYNINYRTYAKGTVVESLSKEILNQNKDLIAKTIKSLISSDKISLNSVSQLEGVLNPNEEKSFKINSNSQGSAINQLQFQLEADDVNQALRSTVLEILFDNERTVWVPVGDFFGTGYKINKCVNWVSEVTESGLLISKWLMPFSSSAKIIVHNYSDQLVKLKHVAVGICDYKWGAESMHFGSAWNQYTNINSKPDRDLNFIELQGQGIYVGDALTVFDTNGQWWGEGDEKIFVDGELFPSHFGTGSEDYYGYAWCMPAPFVTPFIMQPEGNANESAGYTLNARYRLLDGIPFHKSLKFDMELIHWTKSKLNYSPIVYWYAKPGIKFNIKPSIEKVRIPVSLDPKEINL